MKLLLIFVSIIQLLCSTDNNIWEQQLGMYQVEVSLEHDGRRLNVWRENKENRQRFFVTPLAEIIKNSSRCSNDRYSNEPRYVLTFRVRFWDPMAATMVQKALHERGFNASTNEILPLPMQNIRLNINPGVSSNIYVNSEWRSNQNQPNTMRFKLYAKNQEVCKNMLDDLENDIEEFVTQTNLKLEFMLTAAKRESRNLKITGTTVAQSKFFSKLENKYSKNDIVYLNSEDMNKLAREIVHSVVATDEVTSKYIGTDEENKLIHTFIASLKEQKVKATELLKDDWSSVYWDNIYARPDVQTEHYQQSFTYDQGKKQFKYDAAKDQQFRSAIKDKTHRDDSSSSNLRLATGFETSISASLIDIVSGSASGKANFDGSFNISNRNVNDKLHTNDTQTRQANSISEDRMKEHLLQNNQNIKWTGEKFEPKSLDLYRINTRALKAKDEIAFQRVELTLTETIQTIELRPEQTPKDDSEFREWKLKLLIQMDNIKEMKHDQEMKNIQQENELGNVREQIQNNQQMLEKLEKNISGINVQQKNELGNMREQIQNNQQMLEKLEKNISGINVQQKNELGNMREQIQNNQNLLEKVDDILKISECLSKKGKYFDRTNSCYYFYVEGVNWTTAKQRCISKNSNLTSIHSQEENDFIHANAKLVNNHYWWIGLYFDKTGNKWKWIDDGVETKFTNWYSGQPNDYRNHEAGLSMISDDIFERKWTDTQSDTWLYYICKKKL